MEVQCDLRVCSLGVVVEASGSIAPWHGIKDLQVLAFVVRAHLLSAVLALTQWCLCACYVHISYIQYCMVVSCGGCKPLVVSLPITNLLTVLTSCCLSLMCCAYTLASLIILI